MSDLCAFDKVLHKILGGPVFTRQNIIIQLLIDSYAWIVGGTTKLFEVSCLCQLLRYKLMVNQPLIDLCVGFMCVQQDFVLELSVLNYCGINW